MGKMSCITGTKHLIHSSGSVSLYSDLMRHQGDPCGVQVEPGGDLTVGDNEHLPNPGCKALHRAQGVTQLLVVLETAGRHYVWAL